MPTPDESNYGEWIGRSKITSELITPAPMIALAATLDRPTPKQAVPPLWHWVYFLSPVRMTDMGPDGHSKLHDFLPPTPLPRRMRAEGYPGLVVHGPLIATLLLDLLAEHQPAAEVGEFSYTAVGPLFDTEGFHLCGRIDGNTATLWAQNNSGALAMKAQAELADVGA